MKRMVLVLGVALTTSGCWWLDRFFQPPTRLAAWKVERIGVVPFSDGTATGAAPRVTEGFRLALARAIGPERVRTVTGLEGLIGIGQAQQAGRSAGVDALLTGHMLAYGRQPRLGRVWVVVSLRLLEAGRGSIIWSRNATGTYPVGDEADPNAALDVATELAAKELTHDLLVPPTPDRPGGDAWPGQPGSDGNAGFRAAADRGWR
jgi:hypothetical protein